MRKIIVLMCFFAVSLQSKAQTDKEVEITIEEPDKVVSLTLMSNSNLETTAFGFTDGSIVVDIDGGTPFDNGSYTYQWKNSNNQLVNATSAQKVATGYRITLNNVGADTYTLTVSDANYSNATTKTDCQFSGSYTVTQPPKLMLSIQETDTISCNSKNTFNNISNDGKLTANASGGKPFIDLIDGFYEYKYTWKKKNDSGVWETLVDETKDFIENLDAREYAVNIEDKNGVIIGTYTNNNLETVVPNDVTYTLQEPDLLEIKFNETNVSCHNGGDGTITPTITGGTGNYTFLWNNGETKKDIENLKAGTYTLYVTDIKGCQAEASIEITQPEKSIEIAYTFFAPTFAGATNGWIKATITGGTPLTDGSYHFLWENSANTDLVASVTKVINSDSYELTLKDIGEDTYYLTIKDANYSLTTDNEFCTIEKSDYFLKDLDPLLATIAIHKPISCNSDNTYNDPSSDGALIANAQGGVQLQPTDNNGLFYYYTWKKETSPGVWEVLPTQTTNIASGLDAGNYAVNIRDANDIIIGIYENNVLVKATDVTFDFKEPPLLELSITKQDVYCHLGSDGFAEADIKGGIPPYTITWSNGDNDILAEELSAGTYTVTITDDRECKVTGSIEILQPNTPLEISNTAFSRPSTGGASDGWIEAQVIGGTAITDGSYTYTWKDDAGTTLNTQTVTSFVGTANDIFQIRLNDISSGAYFLTIEDANHSSATTKSGCTIIENQFLIYDPIEATIEVLTPISCNQNNIFDNPFSDGKLKATVIGGLPFTTGSPYIFHWKKQDASGTYIDLPSQTTDTAIDLSTGNFALNVEDSLGNVIGVYDSATLIESTDVLFTFEEPNLLEVSLSSTEINCDAGNDGTATVQITGGISPYEIEWSNGQTTPTITGLIANTYIAYITDARGCEVTGQVSVEQPGGLEISVEQQTNPTCYLGGDGSITVNVTGGQAPYTFLWNTGNTTTSIENLTKGMYTFQITDFNNCKAFIDLELTDPDPIIVDLGEDRTLCNEQAHNLDISINDANATYQWTSTNGFTSNASNISITEAGIYTATLTTGLGCVGTDTIEITTSTVDIDSQFLITTQAFAEEDIILINTSEPLSTNVAWILPTEAELIEETSETITIRFNEEGAYQITLRSFQGDCFEEYTKPIVVEEARELPDIGDADTPFIVNFVTFPNPTTGEFTVSIKLQEEATVSLRLFSLISNIPVDDRQAHNASEYDLNYNVSLSTGIYFLLLETAKGNEIRKIVIE